MEELIYVKHGEGITLVARQMQGDYCLGVGSATFSEVEAVLDFQKDREERVAKLVENHVLNQLTQEGGDEPS